MVTLKADATLPAVLGQATELALIRDENGKVLGMFIPSAKAEDILYDQAAKLFDLAEIERREAEETEGHTTEEVMRHLQSLEPSE